MLDRFHKHCAGPRECRVRRADDIHGERILGFVSPVCTEVDTVKEFEALEFELSRQRLPLQDYLRAFD